MRAEVQRVSEDLPERDLRAGEWRASPPPVTTCNSPHSQKAEEVRKVEADLAGKKPEAEEAEEAKEAQETEEAEEEYEYYYEK